MGFNIKKNWFTLVELIVVITIIAILGTIAFISLWSYTTLARNAIRLDGISKVATVVENKTLDGINILAFTDTGQEVSNAEIGWETSTIWVNYQAGEINTSALELKSEDFSDPSNSQLFRMWATTKKRWQFEIVTTVEEWGTDRSKIVWTYEPRISEILSWSWVLWEKQFVLSDPSDLNKLYRWDIVSWTGVSSDTEVQNISADGLTLTLSNVFTANSNGIQLWSDEVSWLVLWVNGATPVTNGSTDIPYTVVSTAEVVPTGPFVTVWKTDNPGVTASNQIDLPLSGTGSYNFTVDWWDGTTDTITSYNQAEATHTYPSAGTYTVTIEGELSWFWFEFTPWNDPEKLIEIQNWGTMQFVNYRWQLARTWDIQITATDQPDLSNLTDMSLMFYQSDFNQDISWWDVSNVENMFAVFYDATSFDQDISAWDLGNVDTISLMFRWASSFNQDLIWDTSNISDMNGVFALATTFNGDISGWDLTSVLQTSYMFNDARAFNRDISDWETWSVTNMEAMFYDARDFNQDINTVWAKWDVSNVENMTAMFYRAHDFNGNIVNWDVTSVDTMLAMFRENQRFNRDISWWNVSGVTDMQSMFRNTVDFDQDISGWNVTNVSQFNNFSAGANASWMALEKPSF